jgi:hypothetical protein
MGVITVLRQKLAAGADLIEGRMNEQWRQIHVGRLLVCLADYPVQPSITHETQEHEPVLDPPAQTSDTKPTPALVARVKNSRQAGRVREP